MSKYKIKKLHWVYDMEANEYTAMALGQRWGIFTYRGEFCFSDFTGKEQSCDSIKQCKKVAQKQWEKILKHYLEKV